MDLPALLIKETALWVHGVVLAGEADVFELRNQ